MKTASKCQFERQELFVRKNLLSDLAKSAFFRGFTREQPLLGLPNGAKRKPGYASWHCAGLCGRHESLGRPDPPS